MIKNYWTVFLISFLSLMTICTLVYLIFDKEIIFKDSDAPIIIDLANQIDGLTKRIGILKAKKEMLISNFEEREISYAMDSYYVPFYEDFKHDIVIIGIVTPLWKDTLDIIECPRDFIIELYDDKISALEKERKVLKSRLNNYIKQ